MSCLNADDQEILMYEQNLEITRTVAYRVGRRGYTSCCYLNPLHAVIYAVFV